MAIADMSKGEAVREVARLEQMVRDRDVAIWGLKAEVRRLSPKVAGPSVLSPADELIHLRSERVRIERIAKNRAIALAANRREREALPTIASVFEVGSPAFHAVWTALQQFVDNRDDSVWYPTMRVFRQGQDGSWHTAMARIVEAASAMAAGKA